MKSYEKTRNYFGKEKLVPIYITVENGLRLQKPLIGKNISKFPHYDEMCRRYLADERDFCEERLEDCGIEKSDDNDDFHSCLENIVKEILRDTNK